MYYSFILFACCCRRALVVGFFFQAEDGIRDLVRSRGLGDVYKRQGGMAVAVRASAAVPRKQSPADNACRRVGCDMVESRRFIRRGDAHQSVSYTHLTLPTSDLV